MIDDPNILKDPQELMQKLQDITQYKSTYKYKVSDNANIISRKYFDSLDKVSKSILLLYVNQQIPQTDQFFVVKEHYTNDNNIFLGRSFRRLNLKDIYTTTIIQRLICDI